MRLVKKFLKCYWKNYVEFYSGILKYGMPMM